MSSSPSSRVSLAERYRAFADQQAAGVSPSFYAWAHAVADDDDVLARLDTLPLAKRQPNLVFAAARLLGARPGAPTSLHRTIVDAWEDLRSTVLTRSTQTNEAARCAALLLGFEHIDGPIALIEVGAAAGLCLVPDRYSYAFSDGTRLDPAPGRSAVTIPVTLEGGLQAPTRLPDIVWRAGLDLNPLDPGSADDLAWLRALVWPEHDDRRDRLTAAAGIAEGAGVEMVSGDLLHDLDDLAKRAPEEATLVVTHSATFAYLDAQQRQDAVDAIARTGARRLGFEGRGLDPSMEPLGSPMTPETLFVTGLDGEALALSDGHGSTLRPAR